MVPFYVIGGVTAIWAVLLSAVGVFRHRFPGGSGGAKVVMGISALLVLATVASGIVFASIEAAEHEEAEAAEAEAEEAAAEEEQALDPESVEQTLELSAVPSGDLAFDVETLEAEPGSVALVMDNPAPIPHNVSLEGPSVAAEGETVEQGGTSTVTAELEPGEYTYYCSVSGHREGGMEGTLTVAGENGAASGEN